MLLILNNVTHASRFRLIARPVIEMQLPFPLLQIFLSKSALVAAADLGDCAAVCWDSIEQEIVPDFCCSNHYCACENHVGAGRNCPAGEGWCSKVNLQIFATFGKTHPCYFSPNAVLIDIWDICVNTFTIIGQHCGNTIIFVCNSALRSTLVKPHVMKEFAVNQPPQQP